MIRYTKKWVINYLLVVNYYLPDRHIIIIYSGLQCECFFSGLLDYNYTTCHFQISQKQKIIIVQWKSSTFALKYKWKWRMEKLYRLLGKIEMLYEIFKNVDLGGKTENQRKPCFLLHTIVLFLTNTTLEKLW